MSEILTLDTYTPQALSTALPTALSFDYVAPGLVAEVGELYGVEAKAVRDDWDRDRYRTALVKELGDVAWFLALTLHLSDEYVDQGSRELAETIDQDETSDPLGYLLVRARNVHSYASMFNPLGYWLSYSEAWTAWHFLARHSQKICGLPWSEVLQANVDKLASRAARNALQGSGDDR